jgi:5'-3' exonuclease
MGIPSYLRHVVTKHREILKKLSSVTMDVDCLYLDCNSDIYDALRDMDIKVKMSDIEFERRLIQATFKRIDSHIKSLNPKKLVYVAFDAVAPLAKLDQQRIRRVKTAFEKRMLQDLGVDSDIVSWSSANITPGTRFMNNLTYEAVKYFTKSRYKNIDNIIVSGVNEDGEGEHKLFEWIRSHGKENNDVHVVKGLDADLIMLSLNHLRYANNLYLTRETPHFIRSIDKSLEPNETYLLDIPEMAKALTIELNQGADIVDGSQKQRMYDYIFMCFFLGNDFMPHFPALNIRTDGMERIMSAYKQTLSRTRGNLTSETGIVWRNVRVMIMILAEQERDFFIKEHSTRDKQAKYAAYGRDGEDSTVTSFTNLPMLDRRLESYINPEEKGWEGRYYKALFGINMTEERKRELCVNYLEGLEWTFKYYSSGCADWRWRYRYDYPPLLSDLAKYVPHFETELITPGQDNYPVSRLVQLSYVLPPSELKLLPKVLYEKLQISHPEWYTPPIGFTWAYCKYFWECHPHMPNIDVNQLESIVNAVKV